MQGKRIRGLAPALSGFAARRHAAHRARRRTSLPCECTAPRRRGCVAATPLSPRYTSHAINEARRSSIDRDLPRTGTPDISHQVIVDSLLMGAAQDSICKDHALDGVPFEEPRDRVDEVGIVS